MCKKYNKTTGTSFRVSKTCKQILLITDLFIDFFLTNHDFLPRKVLLNPGRET